MALLKVENLKLFSENEAVLGGLSFEIDKKGIYAILGKNAKSSSMLAKVLSGIILPDSGSVLLGDTELFSKGGKKLKSKIGYLPKECFLYSDMTAYENLDFTGRMRGVGSDKRLRQIKEALDLLNISHLSEALVCDMNTSEKKRLLLANALIGNPSVLILDEPTSCAFSDDAELICDVISMLGEKKTVLLFTEKISLAEDLADHIGIISGGEMVLWSSLDNIRQKLNGDTAALAKTFIAFTDDSDGGEK